MWSQTGPRPGACARPSVIATDGRGAHRGATPGELTALTGPGGYDSDPAWSPDGARLAYDAHEGNWPGASALWTMDATTGGDVRLITADDMLGDQTYTDPTWAPEGPRLAYVVDTDDEDAGFAEEAQLATVGDVEWAGDGWHLTEHMPAVSDPSWCQLALP